ncbi:MAG: DUF5615 family PIN-like protein [Phycisphaerales bacterium]|nr:DUF5615 family PIN-like protein [Phycisphaerales bacterium]
MNIKLDENLPAELSEWLTGLGHSVDTVVDEQLQGHSDLDVFQAAQREERFLITQDLDFSDIRRFQPGEHAGILLVRLREPTRRKLLNRITDSIGRSDITRWSRCLVVLSETRIRVRRPPD